MRLLTLIFLFLIGQENDVLETTADTLIAGMHTVSDIDEAHIKSLFDKRTKISLYDQRQLSFEIVEFSGLIKIKGKSFFVLFWTYKNEILKVCCYVDTRIYDEPINQIAFATKEKTLRKLQKDYLKSYNISFNTKELDPSTKDLFNDNIGFSCTAAFKMPKLGKEMFSLVKQNNTAELLKWTTAIYPENRIYGYIGLKILKYYSIDKIANRVSQDGTYAKMCAGCSVGSAIKLDKILESVALKNIVESYSKLYNTL